MRPAISLLALALSALLAAAASVPRSRFKRQEADPEPEADSEPEEYAVDYAGNDNADEPKDPPGDTFNPQPLQRDPFPNTDINEDKFGDDNFEDRMPEEKPEVKAEESEEVKPKKKVKKHKYLKKTLDFLKRVLDPNKLMENAYVTEMLRRFSDHEEPEYEEPESLEDEHVHEAHPPKPKRKRRGRPRKKDMIPSGITGIIKKGVLSLTKMELDKKKLRRNVKLIKRIARKAKKPLKTAVKIFLSSRNQGMGGGFGGGGYGTNNNY